MRIGFASTMEAGSWGGSEVLWSETAARLRSEGVDIACNVCSWPTQPAPITRLAEQGCRMHYRERAVTAAPPRLRVRAVNRLKRMLGMGGAPPAQLGEKEQFRQWLEVERPNLVVISQGYHLEGVPFKLACREAGIPYAPIVHSAGDGGWPGDDFAELLANTYATAIRNYFVSEGILNFTRRVLAVPLTDAHIVRNPFNVPYTADPLPWPESTERLEVAVVGRLECVQKGQDLLVEALRDSQWRQRPIRFTLYGKGPNEGRLRALKEMYGVTNVEFGGHDPDVQGIWRRSHALMMPSRYEGLPLTVVEAMLSGRPCIVTDVMGNAELLEDNVTGFIAEAATPRHIQAALERAWSERERWQQMGQAAAESIRQQIPSDPTGVFACELRELAEEAQRGRG